MNIVVPAVLAVDGFVNGNSIRQIAEPSRQLEGTFVSFTRGRLKGFLFSALATGEETLVVPTPKGSPDSYVRVLQAAIASSEDFVDARNGRWIRHPQHHQSGLSTFDFENELKRVTASWQDVFSYIQEDPSESRVGC
jgi:hypothetical protein